MFSESFSRPKLFLLSQRFYILQSLKNDKDQDDCISKAIKKSKFIDKFRIHEFRILFSESMNFLKYVDIEHFRFHRFS